MAHQHKSELLNTVLQLLTEEGTAGLAEGLRLLINEAMTQERAHVLQAQPYERTDARQGHANGFKPKTLATRLGPIQFNVPQVRGDVDFYPSALEKGIRSEQALKLALAEMYVQGVSTRKVSAIVEQLCGHSVSSTQVSQCAAKLDAQLESWRNRPLAPCPYVFLDARYEKVRQGGQVLDCAVLIALGVRADGKRSILGVSVALSEAEVHWRAFLANLQQRGLHAPQTSSQTRVWGAFRRFGGVFHATQAASRISRCLDNQVKMSSHRTIRRTRAGTPMFSRIRGALEALQFRHVGIRQLEEMCHGAAAIPINVNHWEPTCTVHEGWPPHSRPEPAGRIRR